MGFKSKAGKNHYDIRNQRLQLFIISCVSAQKRGDSWWPSLVSFQNPYPQKTTSRFLDENFVCSSCLLNGFLVMTVSLLTPATVTYGLGEK